MIPPSLSLLNDVRSRVGGGATVALFDMENVCQFVMQMPLPGIVIFVHGVNSEGEWFTESEQGLCAGLNRRLGRLDDQLAHTGVAAGQMTPARYLDSLTADGFLNPEMKPDTYVTDDPSFSPVIHFRWGYKANKEEFHEFGDKIMLNEKNYWGGGPFQNGCSSLADLWSEGINDRVFLWLTAQHVNPAETRPVYSTPHRNYGAMGALRLAKLIGSIRSKQADMPITIVCHSQGNIVGMSAAFLGDQLPPVTDPNGKSGPCVADSYVLCNPPYSLVPSIKADKWTQRGTTDPEGNPGRETYDARKNTLKNYFAILEKRATAEMDPARIDKRMRNTRRSPTSGLAYHANDDRAAHGLDRKTYGRATLYCCPHDQLVSVSTVQGFGWRGLSQEEINATGGAGVFSQRVFASGFKVGEQGAYHYWEDDWRYGKGATEGFWYPPSPSARFGLKRAVESNENIVTKALNFVIAPLLYGFTAIVKIPINADPPKGWTIPVTAPALPELFLPESRRYGKPILTKDGEAESVFNEDLDRTPSARDASKAEKRDDDPYDMYKANSPDANPQGDWKSEASQRYEDHATLRLKARREKHESWTDKDGNVFGEDRPADAKEDYRDWRKKEINSMLADGEKANPTNHGTIMTNPMHAEKALAYDVAIGVCELGAKEIQQFRLEADWRFVQGLGPEHPHYKYSEYFETGKMDGKPLHEWIAQTTEAQRPAAIEDHRDGGPVLKLTGWL